MSKYRDYWSTVGTAVIVYVDAAIYRNDARTALRAVQALANRCGTLSLIDFSALLLLNVAHNCPDRYRMPDGRPDAYALTQDRPVDAQRIADAADLVGRFFERPVTDESIRAAEQQATTISQTRPLIQAALAAGPRPSQVRAALRPAAGSLHSISAVISLATLALERTIHHPDAPGDQRGMPGGALAGPLARAVAGKLAPHRVFWLLDHLRQRSSASGNPVSTQLGVHKTLTSLDLIGLGPMRQKAVAGWSKPLSCGL
ncbi:hypothetical protein [Streptomyces phytophilus]|uniref:hypothetical protein n=1 Tax=Streptomyces phytophilus TaxID=722715 RepID=UPI0015F0E5EF|nr:hypothetical protein [Streptomyces phytophilus]